MGARSESGNAGPGVDLEWVHKLPHDRTKGGPKQRGDATTVAPSVRTNVETEYRTRLHPPSSVPSCQHPPWTCPSGPASRPHLGPEKVGGCIFGTKCISLQRPSTCEYPNRHIFAGNRQHRFIVPRRLRLGRGIQLRVFAVWTCVNSKESSQAKTSVIVFATQKQAM